MTPNDIALSWWRVASGHSVSDPDDPFFRFIALWVAFNALYASDPGLRGRERDRVKQYLRRQHMRDTHCILNARDADYARALGFLVGGVRDTRNGKVHRISDPQDTEQVADVLYQVRCNLFHGGKSQDGARDRKVVEAAFIMLHALLRPVLESNGPQNPR